LVICHLDGLTEGWMAHQVGTVAATGYHLAGGLDMG